MEGTQLSTISEEEASDHAATVPLPVSPPATPVTPSTPTTPKSQKHGKAKALLASLKKLPQDLKDIFKRSESFTMSTPQPRRRSLSFGTILAGRDRSAHPAPQPIHRQESLARIRKLLGRDMQWWGDVTRCASHGNAYPSDSERALMSDTQSACNAGLSFEPEKGLAPGTPPVHPGNLVEGSLGGEYDRCTDDAGYLYFRCDIHAADGADFAAAEEACRAFVLEADGRVVDEYEFIGGFMYAIPARSDMMNPLEDGEPTEQGGHIKVSPWIPFHAPYFDGLSPVPPGMFDAHPGPTKEWPRLTEAAAKRRTQIWLAGQRLRAEQAAADGNVTGRLITLPTEESEPVLSARILDPGVELAIVHPDLLAMSRPTSLQVPAQPAAASQASSEDRTIRQSLLSAGNGDEDDGSSAVFSHAETAVVARATPVYLSPRRARGFGEEMRRMEQVYRNFVPVMSGERSV